ncbi:flagellar FliJ family protein [Arthrobacter sp. LAPM80]|uniref:flagellar FliJ family protein n=1 Tax=Arthrobacter sp. LAPM80 TaxID=3141788 RepID=UPI00398A859D
MDRTFRLAGLLRFRQAQEDQAAAALAHANARRKERQDSVNTARGTLAGAPTDPGSAAALRASAAARSASRSMLLELTALSASADEDAAAAQRGLLAAKKTAASLEKLAGRHQLDRHQMELRDEQLFLDEHAVSRAGDPTTQGTATSLKGNR